MAPCFWQLGSIQGQWLSWKERTSWWPWGCSPSPPGNPLLSPHLHLSETLPFSTTNHLHTSLGCSSQHPPSLHPASSSRDPLWKHKTSLCPCPLLRDTC
uniref:Uncharacterized protein n=1 Tax=Phasianus colchicus TaxID=9054 RepID=A0A669QGM4_PHACC